MTWANTALTMLSPNVLIAAFTCALYMLKNVKRVERFSAPVVRELSSYTKFHFSAEEAMLEKTNYPALLPHRAQHQDFIKRVDQFQNDLAQGKSGNSIFVLEFLKDWLSKHIMQTDKKYSEHLNAKGVC